MTRIELRASAQLLHLVYASHFPIAFTNGQFRICFDEAWQMRIQKRYKNQAIKAEEVKEWQKFIVKHRKRERERERQLEKLNGLGGTSANSELSTLWLDNGTISGELEAIVPQAIERNEWKNNEIEPKKKKKKNTHKRNIYWPNDKDAVRFYSDTTNLRLHFLSVLRAREKKRFMNEL